jgi:hypothetical protein
MMMPSEVSKQFTLNHPGSILVELEKLFLDIEGHRIGRFMFCSRLYIAVRDMSPAEGRDIKRKVAKYLIRFIRLYLEAFEINEFIRKNEITEGSTQMVRRISHRDYVSMIFMNALDKMPHQMLKALEKTENSFFYSLFFFCNVENSSYPPQKATLEYFVPRTRTGKFLINVYRQCLLNILQLKYEKKVPPRHKYINYLTKRIKTEARFLFYKMSLMIY